MTIASGFNARRAFIPEVTGNTLPATPAFQIMRAVSGNFDPKKTTKESQEIYTDRNVRSVYQVAQDMEGNFALEFSNASFDYFIQNCLQSAWTANVISNGNTPITYSHEDTLDNGGGALSYLRYTGCQVDSLSLSIKSAAEVALSLTAKARAVTTATAIVSGATYVASNTNQIEVATNVGSLSVAGLTPTPRLQGIDFTIANSLRTRHIVGDLYSQEFGSDMVKITGKFMAYYESVAFLQAALAHQAAALTFQIGGTVGSRYTVSMPQVRLLDPNINLGGRTSDIMQEISFQAEGSAAVPCITITRAV